MPKDGLPYFKNVFAFFFEEGAHEAGVVDCAGVFVADEEAEPFSMLEAVHEVGEVGLEVVEGDAFFVEVDAFGSGGEAAHEGEVAARAAHDFDDEAATCGDCGLFDFIDDFDDVVEGGVGSNAEFGSGEVVVDGGGEADDGDVEGGEVFAFGVESVGGLIACPAADHEDALDAVIFDGAGDGVEVATAGDFAAGAEFCAAHGGPSADAHPVHVDDGAVDESLESVANAEHGVSSVESEPDGGAYCCVHARCWAASVEDCEAEVVVSCVGGVGDGAYEGAHHLK